MTVGQGFVDIGQQVDAKEQASSRSEKGDDEQEEGASQQKAGEA